MLCYDASTKVPRSLSDSSHQPRSTPEYQSQKSTQYSNYKQVRSKSRDLLPGSLITAQRKPIPCAVFQAAMIIPDHRRSIVPLGTKHDQVDTIVLPDWAIGLCIGAIMLTIVVVSYGICCCVASCEGRSSRSSRNAGGANGTQGGKRSRSGCLGR